MRRAYDYWQDQPGCYPAHGQTGKCDLTPRRCKVFPPSNVRCVLQPAAALIKQGRRKPEACFRICQLCIAGDADSPTSRSDRRFSSCLLATFPGWASAERTRISPRIPDKPAYRCLLGGVGSAQDRHPLCVASCTRASPKRGFIIKPETGMLPRTLFSRRFGAVYDT